MPVPPKVTPTLPGQGALVYASEAALLGAKLPPGELAYAEDTGGFFVAGSDGTPTSASTTSYATEAILLASDASPGAIGYALAEQSIHYRTASSWASFARAVPPPISFTMSEALDPTATPLSIAHNKVLSFAAGANQECWFESVIPSGYGTGASNGVTVHFDWAQSDPTTGSFSVQWEGRFQRLAAGISSIAVAVPLPTVTAATFPLPGVQYQVARASFNLPLGHTDLDGVQALDSFRVKVRRLGLGDTYIGSALLLRVIIEFKRP